MAHAHAEAPQLIEKFELPARTRTALFGAIALGVVLLILGIVLGMSGGESHGADAAHAADQAAASHAPAAEAHAAAPAAEAHREGHGEAHGQAHGGHHGPTWATRLWAAFLLNNTYFLGIAVLAIFFIAVSNVTDAGWYILIKRIPEAMGGWVLPGGALALVMLLGAAELYHWWDPAVVAADPILSKKSAYLNASFFGIRLVVVLAIWVGFYTLLRRASLTEDAVGGLSFFHRTRVLSAAFVILFGLSFSVFAWDSLMSLDPHWFSTMFGVYIFATCFVASLSLVTLIAIFLRRAGFLPGFNESHQHDLGKFVFAFSIFWAYITFCQFLLIWYANIPEETAWFYQRWVGTPYFPWFLLNFAINLVVPFLALMPAGNKRNDGWLATVCIILVLGHFIDLWLIIAPTVLKDTVAAPGLMELGLLLIYAGAFLLATAWGLSRASLVAKNHPYFRESLEHHYSM